MPLDTDVYERDVQNVNKDIPAQLISGSDTLTVSKSDQTRDDTLEQVGFFEEREIEVMAVVSEFISGVPDVGDQVTLDTIKHRIERKQTSTCGKAVHLFLKEL